MSGVGTAIGISAGIGAIGSVATGAMGASAAKDAASQQADAANKAAQLQYQASQDALNFQKQQYSDTQKELAPWVQSGTGALSNLNYLLGINPSSSTTSPGASGTTPASPNTSLGSYGSLVQPYSKTFTAPTVQDMQADPGYQARLSLGTDALQKSAAARGSVLTGGTAKALNSYAQDYASNEYNNVFNRSYNTYAQNYNQFQQGQANQYNRLASLSGVGQTTASTLGTLGANEANSVANNLTSTASSMGQDYQNAAAANASGIVGSSNAWGGAINSGVGGLQNMLLLQQLLSKSGTATANSPSLGYNWQD